jgi:alkylation response protein AidB-like acyl-CoA dehydrogenase
MTTTRADVLAMAAALRKALGTDPGTGGPVPGGISPAAMASSGTVLGGTAQHSGWRAHWPALAGLGITAFCVCEDCDGFGSEVPAALVAARELGAALHGSPYAAVTAAGYALSRWLDDDQREAVAGEVTAGTRVPTLAFLGAGATVTEDAGGFRVDGLARLVAGAGEADSYLVLLPEDGALLFVAEGAQCATRRAQDFDVTRSCADVAFTGAPARRLAAVPDARSRVERLYRLLLAGDALGGLGRMLDRTVGYARQRTTFGKAIGGYQAVQHRLVDHTLSLRGMSLLADEAAARLAAEAPGAERSVLLAEAAVAAQGVPMLHDLLQLTGAIGFTWEYGLHLYERRAHLSARLGGNPRQARRSLAELEGWGRRR